MQTSHVVLQNLIKQEEYSRRVLPFLKLEYFDSVAEKTLFNHISSFITKYNASPTFDALYVELTNDTGIPEGVCKEIDGIVGTLKQSSETPNMEWLIETTEAFCKKQALHYAISQAVDIFDGSDKAHSWGAIPDILTNALAVSFDNSIGHDYLADFEKRFEYYHRVEEKIGFDIDMLNKVTKDGVGRKTLNMILAGTHAGKTAMMCHMAARNLMDGKNVLYISLEMSEEQISKRIDANLLEVTMDELLDLTKDSFATKINRLRTKTQGRLKVKEYPTAVGHVGHFRTLLNELKLKQDFVPDIIYIDYLNIAASARIKASAGTTSYTYVKAISEEVRGLAVEFNVPVWSASQFNRGSASSSDPSMDGISESFAVNFIADFIIGLIATEELIQKGIVMVKQLKNRYDDMNRIPKFFVGFDRMRQKFYNLDDALKGISSEHTPVMDTTSFGEKFNAREQEFGSFKF